MKKAVLMATAVVLVLALALPVFAQSMTHNVTYKMSGTIELTRQVGHLCNTGAQWNQVIEGEGEMTKTTETTQVKGKLTVSDNQEWVTAPDAAKNLTVTSAIKLCAPAKSELGKVNLLGYINKYLEDNDIGPENGYGGPYTWADLEEWLDDYYKYRGWQDRLNATRGEVLYPTELYSMLHNHGLASLDHGELDDYINWDKYIDPLTKQVWAVQVEADPGFSGALSQDFEAAYGPYGGVITDPEADVPAGVDGFPGEKYWFFQVDEDGVVGVTTGDDYVGNYFNIEQFARTSQGTTRRFISISSPWSGAYLEEDMKVVGMAEIGESFSMDNLKPGAEAVTEWWDIF